MSLLTATSALIDEMTAALPDGTVDVDLDHRTEASTDYSWLSPVLDAHLPRTIPDVVASPRTVDDLRRVVGLAHRHHAAITARGRATANYGQCVPLAAGVVLDVTGLKQVLDIGEGWITAEPGTSFVKMEAAAARTGQELAIIPSTVRSTLAGFIAGGSAGPGTIENGMNHEGFVLGLDVLSCADDPELVRVEGADTDPHVHGFGTTGVITSATVRLRPARRWRGVFASFDHLDPASYAGREMLAFEPPPRMLAVTEPRLAGLFPEDPGIEPGKVNLRTLVDESMVDETRRVIEQAGGRVTQVRADASHFMYSTVQNHCTLRAKRVEPNLFHVLLRGDNTIGQGDLLHEAFPDAMIQLEGGRVDGERTFAGRILAPHRSDEEIFAGMDALVAAGIGVGNPHTWLVSRAPETKLATALRMDPDGLLNPGKLPGR
ncbi:MAG: FAD-binding oxidoreductase [Acidimicrobiales bacterium]